uniref:hypothetical protein n=1 Tax=Paractinoplanes polyasparticus TaxID=2856853 RepID=UPI001C856259|nr:hypothetical protein [Actinoplanes polyasparticus]
MDTVQQRRERSVPSFPLDGHHAVNNWPSVSGHPLDGVCMLAGLNVESRPTGAEIVRPAGYATAAGIMVARTDISPKASEGSREVLVSWSFP